MARYEANPDGTIEIAETYTSFNELQIFKDTLNDLGWQPNLLFEGRGGYFQFNVNIEGKEKKLHVYLKRLTFGGRENRPFEKRAQFSAAIDRKGFDIQQTDKELSIILAIYKRQEFTETIFCAWDIHDWGYNIGRAFNCFIDVKVIAEALKNGFAQHITSIGQIACCFKPEWFNLYLQNKNILHKDKNYTAVLLGKEKNYNYKTPLKSSQKFDTLFQITLDILHSLNGIAHVDRIEHEAAERLKLSEELQYITHKQNEGNRNELGYQLALARNYLKRAGLIRNPLGEIWSLTEQGKHISEVDSYEIKKAASEWEVNRSVNFDYFKKIKIDKYNPDVELENYDDNFEIESPYDANQVDIKSRTMSLDLILKRLDRDKIDLNTTFQRKTGLWDITRQSRLIESILIKFPLPAFYFDGSDDDKWLVVDGFQRLSSLNNFVNKKTLSLQNLEFLTQFNNHSFTQLPGNLQRRLEEFEITAYIISPATPKKLKYIIFNRINTGGLVLTPQEIRNALNQGKPAEFVKSLSELRSFKKATSFSIQEDHMLDREFITRFLAFRIISIEEYKAPLNSFLNLAMEMIYTLSVENLSEITQHFDKAMNRAYRIFGNNAFRKQYHKNGKRRPINKALFEVWSVLLSRLNEDEADLLYQNKYELNNKFIDLLNNDEEFNWAISSGTGKESRVKKRFSSIEIIIQEILNK